MNIANIFGLHIGCTVKIPNGKIFKIDGVYEVKGTGRPMITDNKQDMNLYIEHCKLILKPLSKITDEDKAEFVKKHVRVDEFVSTVRVEIYNNFSYDVYGRSPSGWSENTEHKLSIDQRLWLASKGYDIGLVPDEYKEVEQ